MEKRAPIDADDEPRWVEWRIKRLLALSLPSVLADQLAHDPRVDIHALLELVDRGCPPHLAARIVAPLDMDPVAT
jgi:hypothetical protein